MYNCDCEDCQRHSTVLNLGVSDTFKQLLNDGLNAFKHLHEKGSYKPEDLKTEKPYQNLIQSTFDVFDFAIQDNDMPEVMRIALQDNARLFGSLKANAQLFEASKLLLKDDGKLKPFSEVSKDFDKLNVNYNQNYLEAEYEFAVASSQATAQWANLGDRYNLQYRTAQDERVRASHQVLTDITLPKEDAFWSSFYPPNGWRCRCVAVEVLKGKYDESDSGTAITAGEKATTEIGKDGKNRLEIFRFNPGAQKVVFPPAHPYGKVKGAKQVEKQVKNNSLLNLNDYIKGELPTNAEVKNIFMKYAELSPEDFRNGLGDVKILKSGSYLMQHSMSYIPKTMEWTGKSSISISTGTFGSGFNPAEDLRGALGAIKKGQKMTFNQEYSLESLWHEILHAKTISKPQKLSKIGIQNMETINQFCARHTYPEFIKKLGGEAAHQTEILDNGYGYSKWVTDFRGMLKNQNIDEKQAYKDLMPYLMEDYGTIGRKTMEYVRKNAKQQ